MGAELLRTTIPSTLRGLAKEFVNELWRTVFGRNLGPRPDESSRRYKYAIRAPWPQPNPHAPDELAPSVLHLPEAELRDFKKLVMGRLTRQLRTRVVPAMVFAEKNREAPAVSDSAHVRYLTETLFSRGMTTELDDYDRQALGTLPDDIGTVYKVDLSPATLIDPVDDFHVVGCISYFARRTPTERCVPLGIVFPEPGTLTRRERQAPPLLIRPVDGEAWELAKHFPVSSAVYIGLNGTHPFIHFPSDAINALAKAILPTSHVLSQLLAPHLFIQLCLNFSVLFIDKSPQHNNLSEFFTGLAYDGKESPHRLMRAVYVGIDGNSSYPGYSFKRVLSPTHSDYSQFIDGYFRVIRNFVVEVLAGITIEDPHVRRWVDACAEYVRDFPTAEELQDHDRLLDTVAQIICNASVVHSVDHYSFGSIPILERSLRMRVPPPTSRSHPPLDRSAFTTVDDRFRLCLTNEMHFDPTPFALTRLEDVDYGFSEPGLHAANARFLASLRAYDQNPGVTRHIPLHDIASSIQY